MIIDIIFLKYSCTNGRDEVKKMANMQKNFHDK